MKLYHVAAAVVVLWAMVLLRTFALSGWTLVFVGSRRLSVAAFATGWAFVTSFAIVIASASLSVIAVVTAGIATFAFLAPITTALTLVALVMRTIFDNFLTFAALALIEQ